MSSEQVDSNPATGQVSSGTRLLPRITVQAFCENSQTAQQVESMLMDRRMSKVALTTHNGGLDGAVETYRASPTPNLLMIETTLPPDQIVGELERLAEFCDPATRVIVLGHVNDVLLYRQLIRSGISEYLVLPAETGVLVSAIVDLFASEDAEPIGRTIGFIGAKGGSGSSTTAHNVSWTVAQALKQQVLIVDLDLAFGTAGLNFNQDPPFGIADAVFAHEKLDAVMLDRLISKAANNINLLTSPGTLDQTYDFEENDFEQVVELVQNTIPMIILDIPHSWNAWVRRTLLTLDEIVIVAEPDLANLRNAKAIADMIKTLRPNDPDPLLVLNKVGVPKRPEISPGEFATAIDCVLIGKIPFDAALFGTAANNGQMIAEVSAGSKINEAFRAISGHVSGNGHTQSEPKSTGMGLSSLMKMMKRA